VRVSTDDGLFGIIATPLDGKGMFRFQLIVGGTLLGDEQPCILGSAMYRLRNLRRLDDAALSGRAADPETLFASLLSDDALHDAVVLELAESLDDWMVVGFLYGETVFVLAQAYEARSVRTGPVVWSRVPVSHYTAIVETVHSYWVRVNAERAYAEQRKD